MTYIIIYIYLILKECRLSEQKPAEDPWIVFFMALFPSILTNPRVASRLESLMMPAVVLTGMKARILKMVSTCVGHDCCYC